MEPGLDLIVLRHGKSDWDAGDSADHERPLAPRGRRAARRMGSLLAARDWLPDRVLCSTAMRARDTAALALEAAGWEQELELRPALYEEGVAAVVAELQGLPPSCERVLLVGHLPWCAELVGWLTGGNPPDFPTGTLARLKIPAGPAGLAPGCARLKWLLTPKLLGPVAD